jgi:synaptobrevin homolog YKT6
MLMVDYVGHVYARADGLVGVLISDKDYPLRVAYSLLTKILDEFSQRYPPSKFKSATSLDFPELHQVHIVVKIMLTTSI